MKATVSTGTLDENLLKLERLLIDNAWALIAGEGIWDGLYCSGLKSISVHNNTERFILSVIHNENVIKRFHNLKEALSDGLLVYFIQEYYEI